MIEEKKKFYTCRSDRAFKEVFMREDSKDILSKVLEAVLKVEVKDIKFLNLERNVDNIHVRRKYFDMFLDTNIGKIQVEVNADYDMSKKLRNTAFICDTYSHLTLKGEKYTDDILVIQINLSYENVKDKYINKIMIRDEDNDPFVRNFIIYDINMVKCKNLWYTKDEEFDKYKESENKDELIITKKQTNKNVKYLLTKKGKQIKLNDNKEQIDLVNEIKSNLKDKYYLYTSSVIDDDQKYVFVDNLKNNSFGIYELKTKKYSEIYKYSKTENIYSNVTKLDSKKGLYYQVNCSSKKCDTPVTVVYDLTENKVILKLESDDKIPEKYIQYNNGYKVIKYSKSSNSDYKNKYVLYDKNNKELLSSDNEIVIIDSEVILGENESTTSLVFYFAKEKKKLNDNNGEIITINNNKYYKYSSDKNIIRNSEGKIIFESPKNSSIIYSDTSIMSLDSENITLKNIAYEKTVKYKLDKNETISNNNLEKINPYKNAIYINNTSEKYIKIVNNKGKTIKKIDDATINKVAENSSSNVVIIVKNSKNKYGLLIGE